MRLAVKIEDDQNGIKDKSKIKCLVKPDQISDRLLAKQTVHIKY